MKVAVRVVVVDGGMVVVERNCCCLLMVPNQVLVFPMLSEESRITVGMYSISYTPTAKLVWQNW